MDIPPSMLGILQKLDLFQDLSPSQLKLLFAACRQETFTAGEYLCKVGSESDRLFILLSGKVEIRSAKDVRLGSETAITTVGETGVLTGEVRAASVVAEDSVTAIAIPRRPLFQLMQEDTSLLSRLYRNAMLIMRQKLIAADQRLEQQMQQAK